MHAEENNDEIKNCPPAKVLWYLPIVPRLKRLFANAKDAKSVKETGKYDMWLIILIGKYERKFSSWDHWNIEDEKYKVPALKVASTSWKNFKMSLITNYLEEGLNPCSDYPYLDEETWKQFCVMKTIDEFLEKREKGRKNAALNTNPARLGASGYRSNYDNWSKEMMDSEMIDSDYSWIEKDRHALEGLWIPGLGEDVLIAMLGPEYPGHTRGVSHTVGLKKTIPRISTKKRKTRTPVDIDWEENRMNFEAECKEKRKSFASECEEKKNVIQC
ncbi:hypothetical protein OSB04_019439 [Centaurea solstitialis]|uniref:Uncharacterized protein n=1 Tax=Centaurea solstitialis TaxID=347529 RepID=A0AA38T1U6_9ASTR|nr:hypothetical protein OSB04_019439 [Centaurea solstitialis]